MSTTLPRSDFLRAPLLATARPAGYQEWHHVIVQHEALQLLVNVSLGSEGSPDRLVPRLVVMAHDGRWRGALERFDPTAWDVSPDLGTITVGANRLVVRPDGYRVEVDLPRHGIAARLDLTTTGPPTVVPVNNKPLGAGRLSWLYVPRLRADGWVALGPDRYLLDGAAAYHDHNWGRFRWGDDFGWTWGSVLPTTHTSPWSFVFLAMTDRRRLRTLSQALYVWHHDEQVGAFRDAAVRITTAGLLGRPAELTLPPPMRLLLGEACGVPGVLTVSGDKPGARVELVFRLASCARLARPSEVCLDRSVVIVETAGRAEATGTIDGMAVAAAGPGIVELLHA